MCTDSLVVSGTSGLSTPVICGSNAGQHSKFVIEYCFLKVEAFYEMSAIVCRCSKMATKKI